MSEDDFSDPYDEPIMEISVETLTGTSFDMRVYPTDTVLDIKNKIQRVEGIPAHHQNLLFQLKELQDFQRMCDVGIVNGSKLKLVLSMRGGPISTRRLSTCDHHIVWKDLKDLIENTREEIGDKAGSKVSVLVFKEGEVINLIRVVENEDGSYSPYTDKAVSPPFKSTAEKDDNQVSFFKKITEEMELASKIHNLKSKIQHLSAKRQLKNSKQNKTVSKPVSDGKKRFSFGNAGVLGASSGGSCTRTATSTSTATTSSASLRSPRLSYRFLNDHSRPSQSSSYDQHLKRFESKITVQENFPPNEEIGEIALKDKHRTKAKNSGASGKTVKRTSPIDRNMASSPTPSENKSFSCKNLHVFGPERRGSCRISTDEDSGSVSNPILSPLYNRYSPETVLKNRRSFNYDNKLNLDDLNNSKMSESIAILEESPAESDDKDILGAIEVPCAETLSLSARNRVHLTQLVLQDSSDRTKSSSESLELDDASQELWEIQHESIKKNATYKLGLLKRRTSVDHTYNADYNVENVPLTLDRDDASSTNAQGDYRYKNSDYEVFGTRNLYQLPHYVSSGPSAIPPQYAPKDERICDLYLGSPEPPMHRSPLYGRRAKVDGGDNQGDAECAVGTEASFDNNPTGGARKRTTANIERLRNDCGPKGELGKIFGFYDTKTITDLDGIISLRSTGKDASPKGEEEADLSRRINRLDIHIDSGKIENLPALNKKRMRCQHCNKRLNITNIHSCRCGRIFCSQHRYSEVHDCKYDYKTEGRRILEQQNPLVTANKLPKF